MPRMFHALTTPPGQPAGQAAAPAHDTSPADDIALGFESAVPALQFDAWEPAPVPPFAPDAY
jgi:hypothetical protein